MAASLGAGAAFVGRGRELDAVRSVIERARRGTAGALLVSGDAGVGKTSLVRRACAEAASGSLVLVGGALPLTSLTVPLLALRSTVRGLPAPERPAFLTAQAGGEALAGAPVLFDEWVDEQGRSRPVVLFVDDLHWADQSTLDVLMYVLAGPGDRRLAVLATVRRGEVGEGHPLQRWLADARRLPLFSELTLGALDRAETREQLTDLLAASPHETLVGEVFARTRGNAYLNRLLVAGLAPDARHVAPDLPTDLRAAVLHAWHRLSAPARELVRVIAVGGQVAVDRRLERAAELAGVGDPAPLLREAVDAGLLDVHREGGYWLHHPLQAEALEGSLAPAERRRLHAAFALACEGDLDDDSPDLESVTIIADHHHLAGHSAEAYAWALRAVDVAGDAGGASEQLRLLRRAIELREHLPSATESTDDLLDRLRLSAEVLGDHEEELAAVEALLAGLVETEQPLRAAELLVRRAHLRFSTGRSFLVPDEMRHAVRLAEHEPRSWQHGLTLAELAHASLWQDDPGAPAIARQALEVASGAGHPGALSFALTANAMLGVYEDRVDDALALAARAVDAAMECRDWWAYVHASLWEANAFDTPVNPVWAETVRPRREYLERVGAPHPYVAWLSSDEAAGALYAGDWERCAERLRVSLGSDPGVAVDVSTRLTAVRLAIWQGRQAEAEAHLARAEELFTDTSTFLAFEFDAVRATVRLGRGDLQGAVEAALTGATVEGVPPTMCEWLMPLAARALADEAQSLRDAGRSPDAPLRRLGEVVDRFPHIIADLGGSTEFYTRELAALDALYAAEVARARGVPEAAQAWTTAACLLEGILPWEQAYACWRAGEALLVRGQGRRDEAAALLRRGLELAERLKALPVRAEIEELARTARIPLGMLHGSNGGGPSVSGAPAGLTPREREILEHIVAGRTYGEIARALVLSEKTVSSHVSNLLRKTGTANRVDLARLATHGLPNPGLGPRGQ